MRKYADQKQCLIVNKAIDDFLKADDFYHHPNRVRSSEEIQTEKRKHDEFWEGFAMVEMIEIFSEDFKKGN